MSQAILISGHQVINFLYELNMRAYVGVNLTIRPDINDAQKLLELAHNFNAIVCLMDGKNKNMDIAALAQFLKDKKIKIPIIVMGELKTPVPNIFLVKNKYEIKSLLMTMAKILEVSAKEMAGRVVPKYFPIPAQVFTHLKSSHCDVYLRQQNANFDYDYKLTLEKDAATATIAEMINNNDEIEHLYIESSERLRFINKVTGLLVSELENEHLSTGERMEVTSQAMGYMAEEVSANPAMTEELANISKLCAKSISSVVTKASDTEDLLRGLLDGKTEYVYRHSVLATYVAGQIIDNISWGSKEQKEKVAFTLFFHDLFLVPIYRKYPDAINEEDLLFRDDISEEDKEIVVDHAKLASHFLKKFPKCPIGADMIVMQHHGMTAGQGFAVNFKDDISPLAKIMIIAEEVSTGVFQEKAKNKEFKISNAYRNHMVKHLAQKFKANSYQKIIDAFTKSKF